MGQLEQADGKAYISAIGDCTPADCALGLEKNTQRTLSKPQEYGIDAFGENGEFHTEVRFGSMCYFKVSSYRSCPSMS